MLVLSRAEGQIIRLFVPPSAEPREIVVTVDRITRNQAYLGFDAPREITILRAELEERK